MSYEKDFLRLATQSLSRLNTANPDFSIVSAEIVEAETCLRQLKIESNYLPTYQRQEVMHRCIKYSSDLNNIKKQLRDCEQEKLFGNKIEQKYKSTTALLEKQGSTLELGKKLSLESEAIATNTMETLRNQRNQLNKATTGAKDVRDNLETSNKLINSIQRRAITNKLIMVCIIFLLSLTILMVGILKITD